MPLLRLSTSASISDADKEELLGELSKITANAIGKPETYMMVTLSQEMLCMSGQVGPAAFADIRSIGGLSGEVNRGISSQVCSLLKDKLGIPANRVYLNFTSLDAVNWGWDGRTFG